MAVTSFAVVKTDSPNHRWLLTGFAIAKTDVLNLNGHPTRLASGQSQLS